MKMQAVILAGGQGSRLRAAIGDIPKPLAKAGGKALLDIQLENLEQNGISDVLILTGYLGQQIEDFCGNGTKWGLNIRILRELQPRGTAGAVLDALNFLNEEFIVLYGDTVFDLDFDRMARFHKENGGDATLLLHPSDHPQDSDLVSVDDQNNILSFHPYPHADNVQLPFLNNAAAYVIRKECLQNLHALPPSPDFGKHVFPHLITMGRVLKGYRSPEYIKDAGTPERLEKVSKDLLSGRVCRTSLRHCAPAIFIDRDGTILSEDGYITSIDQVSFLGGAVAGIECINRSEYRAVLVTNQPVVARGDCSERQLFLIHSHMEKMLAAAGAHLDALYFCPHHPDSGFIGERIDLKVKCQCRKPGVGMIETASRDLNIDLSQSWVIGDSTADTLMANRAGLKSVMVQTGRGGVDGKWNCAPDLVCKSLAEAAMVIVDYWPNVFKRAKNLVRSLSQGETVTISGADTKRLQVWAAAVHWALKDLKIPSFRIQLDVVKNLCDVTAEVLNRKAPNKDVEIIEGANAFLTYEDPVASLNIYVSNKGLGESASLVPSSWLVRSQKYEATNPRGAGIASAPKWVVV